MNFNFSENIANLRFEIETLKKQVKELQKEKPQSECCKCGKPIYKHDNKYLHTCTCSLFNPITT